MRTFVIFTLLFILFTACSVVENAFYVKNTKRNSGWIRERDAKYQAYYRSFHTNSYQQNNNTDTIIINVTSSPRALFIGPPLIPIFPVFYIKGFNDGVYSDIHITSSKNLDIEQVLQHIRFTFNDTVRYTPEKRNLRKNGGYMEDFDCIQQVQATHEKNDFPVDHKVQKKSITIGLYFTMNPKKIRKIKIEFDDKIISQLSLNPKPLELKKRIHLQYTPFVYMAH